MVAAFCFPFLLASCGTTKKFVTETTNVSKSDTVYVAKSDTVYQYRTIKSIDTVVIQKENTITLLQPVDKTLPPETIKVVNNTDTKQISSFNDSVYQLKSMLDVLINKSKQEESNKKVTVKRVIPWQEYVMFICGVALFFAGVWVLSRKTANKDVDK